MLAIETRSHHSAAITGSRPISRASCFSRANTRSPRVAVLARELEFQLAALHDERRIGQHARHGARHQIGDPHGGAETRAWSIMREFASSRTLRRQFIVRKGGQPDVAEKHGEREERAARMIDADESRVRDDVERLLAAIIRMPPPANVREEAGGAPQAFLIAGLVEAGGCHEFVGPVCELLAMAG